LLLTTQEEVVAKVRELGASLPEERFVVNAWDTDETAFCEIELELNAETAPAP
jgi:hypothetical protein